MTQLRPEEVFRKFKFRKTDFKCRRGARRENSRQHQVDPRVDWGVDTQGGCVESSVDTPVDTGGSASLAGCTVLAFGLCLVACDEI